MGRVFESKQGKREKEPPERATDLFASNLVRWPLRYRRDTQAREENKTPTRLDGGKSKIQNPKYRVGWAGIPTS
jgi:hypothetical protein